MTSPFPISITRLKIEQLGLFYGGMGIMTLVQAQRNNGCGQYGVKYAKNPRGVNPPRWSLLVTGTAHGTLMGRGEA